MSRHIRDDDTDLQVDELYGVGLSFTDDEGNVAESVAPSFPREAYLSIASYDLSYTYGAKHYYGQITTDRLAFVYTHIAVPGRWDISDKEYWTSGRIDRFKPKEMLGLDIELMRLVTKEELETERFEGYEAGFFTNAFGSADAVKVKAITTFKKIFRGRWVLRRMYTDEILCGKENQ